MSADAARYEDSTFPAIFYPTDFLDDEMGPLPSGYSGVVTLTDEGITWAPHRSARRRGIQSVHFAWKDVFGADLTPVLSRPIYYWLRLRGGSFRCVISFSFDRVQEVKRILMNKLELDREYEGAENLSFPRFRRRRERLGVPPWRLGLLYASLALLAIFAGIRGRWTLFAIVLAGMSVGTLSLIFGMVRQKQESGVSRAAAGFPTGLRSIRFIRRQ